MNDCRFAHMSSVSPVRLSRLPVIVAIVTLLLAIQPVDCQNAKTGPSVIEIEGVHNAFKMTDRIYSGSQPEGEAAFAALAKLGIKTILSVDGAKPDVEMARKFGLRYIHLPVGYDGISAERAAQLAQAATAGQGPIFVHCHHGKHRGPTAAGIMCEASEGWTPEQTESWMQSAGTATDYPGLYAAVKNFKEIPKEELARRGPLPEVMKTEPVVDSMVAIDERFDALKGLQKSGWKASEGATAAATATLLWEQIRELSRTDDTAKRSKDYRAKMADCELAADALRTGLNSPTPDLAAVETAFKQVGQTCSACHKAFRNKK